jgi:hypothetical protein
MAGEPPLEIVVALHVGAVIYGNIGAADRLDFTVIGPAGSDMVARSRTHRDLASRLRCRCGGAGLRKIRKFLSL